MASGNRDLSDQKALEDGLAFQDDKIKINSFSAYDVNLIINYADRRD